MLGARDGVEATPRALKLVSAEVRGREPGRPSTGRETGQGHLLAPFPALTPGAAKPQLAEWRGQKMSRLPRPVLTGCEVLRHKQGI